jgi:phosphate transport system protein
VTITPQDLREMVIKMASSVEAILQKCLAPDASIDEVQEIEDEVNLFHTTLDDTVFKYIALRHPAARDLREALAIMKINTDLERISDQSINIKRYWDDVEKNYPEVFSMKDEVFYMVKSAMDSFVHSDIELANKVIAHDKKVNQLNKDLAKSFLKKMKTESMAFHEGYAVVRVVKNLERIGDLATNISEDVIFLESGADIRHQPQREEDKK